MTIVELFSCLTIVALPRFVIELATQMDGVILSNDNYRDLWDEKREWRKTIETRHANSYRCFDLTLSGLPFFTRGSIDVVNTCRHSYDRNINV